MSLDNLPVEWFETKLDQIAEWGSGGTPSRKNSAYYGGDVPWIKTGDLGEKYVTQATEFITDEAVKNSSAKYFKKGSVIMAMYGATIGKTSILGIDATTNQACAVGTPIATSTEFLYYFLRNEKDAFIAKGKGGAQPNISQQIIKAHTIFLPSQAEQQEIVRQLDVMLAQVEQIKARLDAIPAILKKFRQSVLADAVSGKLCRADESFKEIIVENTWKHSIYGLPHWKEYKFSDVVDIIGGSQPPKSEFRSEYQEGYIRLIQIRDYKSDSHIVYIPKEKARRFVSPTDVMIGRYGPPIFQILRGLEGAYNVALMKAEPKDNLIDQEYLYWYLQNYKIYNYIEAGSDRTAGQSGVNKKHLEAYPILLPSIEEQQNIVKEIVKLTTLANRIEETLQLAEKRVNLLTQSILAKAFSGELTAEWREQHQDLITGVNSAESLLAKIQAEREASKPVKKAKKVK